MEIVHALFHHRERSPRTPLLQGTRTLGNLTLFQQPWTGKPSSPCSEEGRQTAQTLRDGPPSSRTGGTRATNIAAADQGAAPRYSLSLYPRAEPKGGRKLARPSAHWPGSHVVIVQGQDASLWAQQAGVT